jgi:hypothetical protein
VLNYTTFDSMWFRYGDGTTWSSDVAMAYNEASGKWEGASAALPTGIYLFEVYGMDANNTEHVYSGSFTVAEAGAAVPVGTRLVIMTPANGAETYSDTAVRVQNLTSFESMWYRYRTAVSWSENVSMTYSSENLHWYDASVTWAPGVYELQVFGETSDGSEYMAEVTFTVPVPFSWVLVIGAAAAVFGLTLVTYMFWWRKRGRGEEESSDIPPELDALLDSSEEKTPPKKTPPKKTPPKKSKRPSSKKKATKADKGGA